VKPPVLSAVADDASIFMQLTCCVISSGLSSETKHRQKQLSLPAKLTNITQQSHWYCYMHFALTITNTCISHLPL